MPLGDRIRTLRKEHRWSQAELGERIGTDPGRISRYEAGRITPSAEALIRPAETFNVSLDHLLIDDIPRRPLHGANNVTADSLIFGDDERGPTDDLALVFEAASQLDDEGKNMIRALVEGAGL